MIRPEDISDEFPVNFTTTELEPYLPGLIASDGRDHPVYVNVEVKSIHHFDIVQSSQSIIGLVDIDILL